MQGEKTLTQKNPVKVKETNNRAIGGSLKMKQDEVSLKSSANSNSIKSANVAQTYANLSTHNENIRCQAYVEVLKGTNHQ